MIALILYDLRWRIVWLVALGVLLYALEPGFHQHDAFDIDAVNLGPLGVSAAIAHFAGLAMVIQLAGFISRDRDQGYSRIYFSNPTSPLAFYGLKIAVAYGIALVGAVLFLTLGQIIAWGRVPSGWEGLILPALTGLIYGGLIAFLSALLPRGDGTAAFILFLPTFFPEILTFALGNSSVVVRQAVLLIVPPQGAIAQIWDGLLFGIIPWLAVVYSAAYGVILLAAAGVLLSLRDWP